MPEMGAGELVDQLVSSRPELKVLYISGYTNDEVMRRGISRTEAAFIQKPFTSGGLVAKVAAALSRAGAPAPPSRWARRAETGSAAAQIGRAHV